MIKKDKAITKQSSGDLFIVDNSDSDWKVLRYLHDWCEIAKSMDVATGYFEIGSLLSLDTQWQKLDNIRILMGDEVSKRTKQAFISALGKVIEVLDLSIEKEKEENDFLTGVSAIVNALRTEKIVCRVYRKKKFHAKAYITHGKLDVIGSAALVGSSNFTFPGLTENVELNIQIRREVNLLQDWFEGYWEEAEDVTPEILKTIERHIRDYTPFEIYAKSLQEFFRGHELTASEWEMNNSQVYPILAKYQKDGYHALLKYASKYNGAFCCDGVGLGKTFIGLMLIERLVVHDNKRVALFVPKASREAVWEATLKQRLPEIFEGFYSFKIFNHTDLLREKMYDQMEQVRKQADVIIIDEAHHFRNTGIRGEGPGERKSRYWQMYDIIEGKQLFMLTATPVNNRLIDFQHMVELFSRHQTDYFKGAPLGIHSLRGHILKLDKALEIASNNRNPKEYATDTNLIEAEKVLSQDDLFQALVVQRSRAYVKESMINEGDGQVLFPKPREPKVVPYSVKQTYGKLLNMIEEAFNKENPLFSLSIYYPYAFYKGPDEEIDRWVENRQKQVVRLIRIGFLKRFESSVEAFTMSCWNLLHKFLAWLEVHVETDHEKKLLDRWKRQHKKLIEYVRSHQKDLLGDEIEEEADEDIVAPEMLEAVEKLSRDDFKVDEIIHETLLDLDQIADFLRELQNFKPSQDKKLRALIRLLQSDSVLQKHKVIIYTEFMDTARYLRNQLGEEEISNLSEIDSAYHGDRTAIIRRFSPYYNGSSSDELSQKGEQEIRVLISTDVLSEGLNLQDATRLINYDLHWNPVRLMQRIGRIDRRLDPDIEERIISDHPEQKKLRGEVAYWNFLPPDELDELLRLYSRVAHKTLRISKTFGIEGRKLLTPEDEYDDLKNFMMEYEGKISPVEAMKLEYQQLLKEHPDLEDKLEKFPLRVFSGKEHPTPEARAVFFCYARPAHDEQVSKEKGEDVWSVEAGDTKWYLYDIDGEKIIEEPTEIIDLIRSFPDTQRICLIDQPLLIDIRKKIDTHIKNTYLKKVQAPIGVKPILKAWMELN